MLFKPNRVSIPEKQKLNYYQQLEHKAEKLKQLQEETTKKVKDWAEFSLNPQSEEDIRKRVLNDNKTGENTYCMTYILSVSQLSEEFIEELILLTRPKRVNSKNPYKNKIDWSAVSSKQKLSENFIIRHEKDVNWRMIYQFQDLSDDFRRKYAYKLATNDRPKTDD